MNLHRVAHHWPETPDHGRAEPAARVRLEIVQNHLGSPPLAYRLHRTLQMAVLAAFNEGSPIYPETLTKDLFAQFSGCEMTETEVREEVVGAAGAANVPMMWKHCDAVLT